MSAPKHTPGPWKADKCGCITAGNKTICHSFVLSEQCGANQNLIAAAPDMLDVLKTVLRFSERNGNPLPFPVIDLIGSAIDAAEGRAS